MNWLKSIVPTCVLLGLLAASAPSLAAEALLLPTGEPNPAAPDIRLWLRADSGIYDSQSRPHDDPKFNGQVAEWRDRSTHKFDLKTMPGWAPLWRDKDAAAGEQPTILFSGRQMLSRVKDTLHDSADSTAIVVFQGTRGGEGAVYSIGQNTERFVPNFSHEPEPFLNGLGVWNQTTEGPRHYGAPLQMPRDGAAGSRFAAVIVQFVYESRTIEYIQALGGPSANRKFIAPFGQVRIPFELCKAASNKCPPDFFVGIGSPNEPHTTFTGSIAEMLFVNRGLTAEERRDLELYLRKRYRFNLGELPISQDTIRVEAEDFEGKWSRPPPGQGGMERFLGGSYVTAKSPIANEPIRTTITIPRDGKYRVWIRAQEDHFQKGQSAIRSTIQNQALSQTHKRGPGGGMRWREAGEVDLKAGPAEITIQGDGPGEKLCDAVVVNRSFENQMSIEEFLAISNRFQYLPARSRLTAILENGVRIDGNLIGGWRWFQPSGEAATPATNTAVPFHVLRFDRPNELEPPTPFAVIEFHNGDRLQAVISGFVPSSVAGGKPVSAKLLVRPPQGMVSDPKGLIAVEVDWIRRVTMSSAVQNRDVLPQTLVCRDGRRYAFRALRWGADSFGLLTEEGLVRVPLSEVAEMRLANSDPWDAYFRELAYLNIDGELQAVHLTTTEGMRFTASRGRMSQMVNEGTPVATQLSVQPIWCQIGLVLKWADISEIGRMPANLTPLSRFAPSQATQRGSSLAQGWSPKINRNVQGGPLSCNGNEYLWGIGVQGPNELAFDLPECVVAFRTYVGIDSQSGKLGSAIAKVFLNDASRPPLFQSEVLVGSEHAKATGDIALPLVAGEARRLFLVTEHAKQAGEKAFLPLEIGDQVDWLEPVLVLDSDKLKAEVAKKREALR